MKPWLLVPLVSCVVTGTVHGDETYRCSSMRASLLEELRRAELHPIRIASAPQSAPDENGTVEPCEDFDRVRQALRGRAGDTERGTLGGQPAAVRSSGPHGSGHYWDLTLAIVVAGRTLGACLTTATSGWRNLPADGARRFGRWRALASDHLSVWSTLAAGAAESESLIVPLLFRLADVELRLDRSATLKEVDRFGRLYAEVAAMRDDHAAAMHRAAAAAYRAVAGGGDCE